MASLYSVTLTYFLMEKISNDNMYEMVRASAKCMTFLDFDICHRRTTLQKLYSVILIFFWMSNIWNASITETARANLYIIQHNHGTKNLTIELRHFFFPNPIISGSKHYSTSRNTNSNVPKKYSIWLFHIQTPFRHTSLPTKIVYTVSSLRNPQLNIQPTQHANTAMQY